MAMNNRTPGPASSDVIEIRNYPASLIHEHVSSDDGSVFQTLYRILLLIELLHPAKDATQP